MEKKIKVLMVNYEFPPIGGGGGTTTRYLAKYMVRLGVDVNVLTAKPGNENFYDHPDGFRVYYVGPKKDKHSGTHIPELARFILTTGFYSKTAIKTIKPNLLHCFFTLPSGCIGLFLNKLYKIPYITSALGADVPGFNIGDWRLNAYHALTEPISKAIWDYSSSMVANSESLSLLCKKFDPKKEIITITNGVDTDEFFPNKTYSTNQEKVQLLFISRLMPQKGIDTLIYACSILKNRGIKNFKLTVIGDGHLKTLMNSIIKSNELEDCIDHLGWKTLEELPDYYRNADVFILPSSMEGMPSVVLQAMACGLPIIATRVDGFKEILEENVNGFFAEYNKPEDLANQIEKLINSPELREKMSKESIRKSKHFSWQTISEKYLELYEKAVFSREQREDNLALIH